ncbi:extracellular solute-binding protein [Paenibacillus paeoniae]|uniref:Extracellular solute-binding protein n=1 Tax=Paenibacillus paeoniae TaxID=2292705 RepID=A0A371P246_9BACL|nr:extracellular solute-binding protein [Paenibacillus paeoniae]REK69386.1 extracellular solute-binding protein [Paenibacillus paeoniae]
MNKKREMFMRLLLTVLTLSLIWGCSNAGSTVREQEVEEHTTQEGGLYENGLYVLGSERLDISFYAHYSYYSMPSWGSDPASKWIRDQFNIHVTPISSDGKARQKLQKMIAGNHLPNIVWGDRGSDLEQMREAGLLVPLDAYIDKYPNLKHWAGDKILELLRSSDGHIYYFPNYYTNRPYGNSGYVINKKIYRELGFPPLETTEDLYHYLQMVKESYPNVIPFETGQTKEGHGIDQLFSAFKEENLGFTRLYAVTEGDRMSSIYKDEAFRESAVYVARLMREGLIPTDAMTQTEDQIAEKLMLGRVAVYASANPMINAMVGDAELRKVNPDDGYMFIEPIYKQGLDRTKIYPGTYNILGWNVASITTSARNPEAIFAMLDWMTGPEGSAVQMWGPPGPAGYWNGFLDDGITPNFTARYGTDPKGLAEIQAISGDLIWVGNTVYLDKTKSEFEQTLPEEQQNWSTYWQQKITWKSQGDATEFINVQPAPNSEEGQIMSYLREIWLDARRDALFGKSDEEVLSILDDAHRASMEAGFQQYLNDITTRWQDNVKVLNNK